MCVEKIIEFRFSFLRALFTTLSYFLDYLGYNDTMLVRGNWILHGFLSLCSAIEVNNAGSTTKNEGPSLEADL